MLARAARRKLHRDAFRSTSHLSEQLALPWLCPAQMRYTVNTAHDSRPPRRRNSLSPRHETRSLATAADLQPSQSSQPPPFDGLMQPWGRMPSPDRARLGRFESPLVIHDSLAQASTPHFSRRFGIGGDPVELHQNLYACLRVGRLDRATAIIQRLSSLYSPSAPEVVDAHNVFLQAMFELAEQDPKPNTMTEISEWFDTHMIRGAIEPNAQTFVTLLRASMNFLQNQAKDDAVRRYLAMASEYGADVIENINSSPEFSDEEWDMLIRLQPDTFEEPPPIEEVQDSFISTPAGRASLMEHGFLPNPAHNIKPVPQKGLGLDSLKQALAVFDPGEDIAYPHDMNATREEKDRTYNYARQLRMEQDSINAAIERWKAEDTKLKDMGIHGVLKTKPIQALMWNWYSALLPLVQNWMKHNGEVMTTPSSANNRDDAHICGPYIEHCNPDQLAALTISTVLQACARGSHEDLSPLKVAGLSIVIGQQIENQVNTSAKQRREAFLRTQRNIKRRQLLGTLNKNPAKSGDFSNSSNPEVSADNFAKYEFPLHVKTKIGAKLLELVLQSAKITVTAQDPKSGKTLTSTQAAFHHHTGFQSGKRIGWIAPHREVVEKLRSEPVHGISTVKLPMLVEPKPWSSYDVGGYYTHKEKVVRNKAGDSSQRAYTHSAIENGDMNKVLAGLDVLGKVPWQINSNVFNVMAEAWNAGEGIAKLVPEKIDLQPPPEPASDASFAERAAWMRSMKEYDNTKSGLHSQRCFQNFQLEVARAFLKEKQIFFPHSVDFRGRAYPLPPILNHIGSDLARSLLIFANGKELGAVGLQWLKVHLANLYGYDKASLKEREQFAMDSLDEIYDSATNPLSGRRWWTKAEDPWQCLGCCFEIKSALESPDPARFVSHLPIHQDGTCNGLQHYAALGGDHAGASQVNLEPSDKPQDIYTGVAELVQELVAEDAAKENSMAKFVDGKIARKVVKRTVMTNVYGVTFMGAKTQVYEELKEMFPNFKESRGVKSLHGVALYVAQKIFAALGKIFNGAQEIQYWLGECGDRITTSLTPLQIKMLVERHKGTLAPYDAKYKSPEKLTPSARKQLVKNSETFKSSIIWTTPLRMPVVQPYRKNGSATVKTSLQDISVIKNNASDVVDKRKQLQAFPPNFIHSLDASHMLLSALKCDEMGLNFAAVHDSFWTHAADIPTLNTILRDAFVRMHSEDIIGRLAAEFETRYAGSMYRATLIGTSAVAHKITQWRWENAGDQVHKRSGRGRADANFDELVLEAQRQELLNSEDPIERKKGEEMVTPTSIWMAEGNSRDLHSYRLALLGETKKRSSTKFDEVKDKVLGAESVAAEDEKPAGFTSSTTAEESIDEELETIEAEAKAKSETEDEAAQADEPNPSKKGSKASSVYTITAWLPLRFPAVPKKGSWDVTRLRESKYFFS